MAKSEKKEVYTKGVVKCPHCGHEYALDEIFMPGQLIGKSATVVKDPTGRILYIDWEEEPELIEHFECEGCGKSFVVEATIQVKTRFEDEAHDFDELSTSLVD